MYKSVKVKFKGFDCLTYVTHYLDSKDLTALILYDEIDNDKIATASINVSNLQSLNVRLDPNYIAIKDYSENTGMLETLINAKVIDIPAVTIKIGHITIPICKLLLEKE